MNQMNDLAMTSYGPKKRIGVRRWLLVFGAAAVMLVALALTLPLIIPGAEGEDLVEKGRDELARHNLEAAIKYSKLALKLSPELPSGLRLLAEATGQNRQFNESISALIAYSRQRPNEAGRLAFRWGNYWMQQNLVCPAASALRISEDTGVMKQQSLLFQLQIAAVTGHTREASRCAFELLKIDAFTRGDLVLLTAQFPRVSDRDRLEAILRTDSSCRSSLLAKALDELNENHISAAEKILVEVTSSHPDDLDAQGTLADLYAHYSPEKFVAWFSTLPVRHQADSRMWTALGKWLADRGQNESAIRCLYEGLQREPEHLAATTLLGQLLKSQNHTGLGTEFTERAKRMQKIIELNGRLNESRSDDVMLQMIDELEQTGRLWEAWGFCEIYQLTAKIQSSSLAETKLRLKRQLTPDLPRTKPGSLPGVDFDWQQFELPDLSKLQLNEYIAPDEQKKSLTTLRFSDLAEQSGLDFRFANSCQPNRSRRILETMGAGVAVLDFDLDGSQDLYFPQGSSSPTGSIDGPSDSLYRNINSARFDNVSSYAAIRETSYSQGVAAGDFDNDGFPDLYVANFGRNTLFHNNGDGTFTDVTQHAGLTQTYWTVSCAIADLDNDGSPELFDVNYVQGNDLLSKTCLDQHGQSKVCRPTFFEPAPDAVLRNLGNGRFTEQQSEAGLDLPGGMGLGIIVADFSGDNHLDIFIANDMHANYLLINRSGAEDSALQFTDEGFFRNVALDENGLAQACMGVACADINHDRQLDLFVTNFAKEANTLYLSGSDGFYHDATQAAGLRQPSFEQLGFGTQFIDVDQNGCYDLVVLNGHIDEFVGEEFHMKPQIFRGEQNGDYTEVPAETAGPMFAIPRLGRGMALLDWNRDGRTDFVATDLEGPVLLGVNESESPYRSLRLKLVGTQSSRDAIGAKVTVHFASNKVRSYQMTAGDGFESSNERVIEICLGEIEGIDRVEINWPSNTTSSIENVQVEGQWIVIEGRPDWIRCIE